MAGTNYFVKVTVNDQGSCVHLRVHRPLPRTGAVAAVAAIRLDQTRESPVEYFEGC